MDIKRPRLTWVPRRQVLIPGEMVDDRIISLAEEVDQLVPRDGQPLKIVSIASGGVPFAVDLIKHLHPNFHHATIKTASYGDKETGEEVRLEHDGVRSVQGHRVLLVDDIGDRRRTLDFASRYMTLRGATDVKTCVLLNKPDRKEVDVPLDFVGFNIKDEWVWGRGLNAGGEFDEETRNDYDVCYFGDSPATSPLYAVPSSFPQ